MTLQVAIVGTGPMGIYTLAGLIEAEEPMRITLFERGETAGIGLPYSPEAASSEMLANIASIEIPPVTQSYLAWLQSRPEPVLSDYRLTSEALNERLFTPRLLLGSYFRDGLLVLLTKARMRGHSVTVCEGCEVVDILPQADGLVVQTTQGRHPEVFDRLVLATGHSFDAPEAASSYFPNPYSGLISADILPGRVGILGTSLSGIDAALAVAMQHGRLLGSGATLQFEPQGDGLQISLMSRNGLLPEADFYCPLPYYPLQIMTEAALEACKTDPSPLEAGFELFRAELTAADPAYAATIGLAGLSVDSFAEAYFAERRAADPFRWAEDNLAEVEANARAHRTVAWRYAILRMHEQLEALVPDFSEIEAKRFASGLKRVFIDNYAAVPPESIRRLLALRDAGVLEVRALGDDYTLDVGDTATRVVAQGEVLEFDTFIDARGQKALTSADLPFASLREALLQAGQELPQVDQDYALAAPEALAGRIYLGAIPYLMHDRPFVQGITACAEIGGAIAKDLRAEVRAERRLRRRWA
jgi:uncharacterized NAD(P)/FAD-binding protein YdhS